MACMNGLACITNSPHRTQQDPRQASVSVVIPTYNGSPYIDQTLQSVFNQTQPPQEIIVVDDASTDDTVERVKRIAQRWPIPLKLIQRATNSGSPAAPMNAGIATARGDLIAVLDQDDVFAPRKIELQRRILCDHPDVGFVAAMCGRLDQPDREAQRTKLRRRAAALTRNMTAAGGYYLCDGNTAFRLFVRHENFVTGFPGFMFRRALWEAKGGLDERLAVASDYGFLCWMCTAARMAFVADIHYLRREHMSNLSRHETRRLADVVAVLAKHVDACGEPRRQRQIRRALAEKLMRMALYFGIFRNWREAYCLWAMTTRIDRSFGGVCRSILLGLRVPHRALRHRQRSSLQRSSRHELQQTIETLHLLLAAAGLLPPQNHQSAFLLENCNHDSPHT